MFNLEYIYNKWTKDVIMNYGQLFNFPTIKYNNLVSRIYLVNWIGMINVFLVTFTA